jgi:hypothetical protein
MKPKSWNQVSLVIFSDSNNRVNSLSYINGEFSGSNTVIYDSNNTYDNSNILNTSWILGSGFTQVSPTSLSASTSAWSSTAYSSASYRESCYLSYTVDSSSVGSLVFGLTDNPSASVGNPTYAFNITGITSASIQDSQATHSIGVGFTAPTTSTVFALYYNGTNVYLLVDGVVRRVTARNVGSPLYAVMTRGTVAGVIRANTIYLASNYTLYDNNNIVNTSWVFGSGFTQDSPTSLSGRVSGWSATAYSATSFRDSCYLSYTVDAASAGIMIFGLSDEPGPNVWNPTYSFGNMNVIGIILKTVLAFVDIF